MLNRSGVRNIWIYLGPGVLLWIAVFLSGVDSTLAGVLGTVAILVRAGLAHRGPDGRRLPSFQPSGPCAPTRCSTLTGG
ncbi:Na+/H+ antiporter NhaA|uniref:Na+/H+ antiporter NhaA n=1 Tax=Rhizobium altiplani TaxID=1864509 RepID=UPI002477EDC9|nr:Na+/H+ antiporter NhaA [Rhizobium altiplani]